MENNIHENVRHRDLNRSNSATKAVQATIYRLIAQKCVDRMVEHFEGDRTLSLSDQRKLLTIHTDAMDESFVLYLESQNNIPKDVCLNYAKTNLRQLTTAMLNGEDVRNIQTISNYIINDNIIEFNEELVSIDQSGKFQ